MIKWIIVEVFFPRRLSMVFFVQTICYWNDFQLLCCDRQNIVGSAGGNNLEIVTDISHNVYLLTLKNKQEQNCIIPKWGTHLLMRNNPNAVLRCSLVTILVFPEYNFTTSLKDLLKSIWRNVPWILNPTHIFRGVFVKRMPSLLLCFLDQHLWIFCFQMFTLMPCISK